MTLPANKSGAPNRHWHRPFRASGLRRQSAVAASGAILF